MDDFWLIVGAIVLINCGWWLIYQWFLSPQLDRVARDFDAACDSLEGRITRANEERDKALAEVGRLKAENARLWSILVRPYGGEWMVCTTATTFKPDEAEARAFVLGVAEQLNLAAAAKGRTASLLDESPTKETQ